MLEITMRVLKLIVHCLIKLCCVFATMFMRQKRRPKINNRENLATLYFNSQTVL